MTEQEKELKYREAVGYLTSSLTNDETIEESLLTLQSLGDYKDAAILYERFQKKHTESLEEKAALLKKRKTSRKIQAGLVGAGALLVLGLILLLVYALKLDIVR